MTLLRDVRVVLVALVLVIASPARANEPVILSESRAPATDESKNTRALRLGEHFYRSGQFYRAVGAFEELALFTDDRQLAAHARLRIAMALQRGEQHADAVAAYDRWLADPASPRALGPWVRIQRALARAGAADRLHIDDVVAELAPLVMIDGPPRATAAYHLARLQLLDGQRAAAARTVADASAACKARPVDDCAILDRIDRAASLTRPRRRSAALAVTLSAIVPGAGSVYTGHHVDGAYYLILTSAAALGAWDVHDGDRGLGDQKATFYALGTFAAVTYTASLIQGYVGARRFNLSEELRWRRRVVDATEVPLPLDAHPALLDQGKATGAP